MKRVTAVFLTLVMSAGAASGCRAEDAAKISENTEIILQINRPTMLVNGVKRNIDADGTAAVIQDNRTFLPARAVTEAMGGAAEWDENAGTVILTRNADTIRLTIGSETAYLNDTPKTLDAPPVIVNGRTMLPVRFLAESFGFEAEWNDENRLVTIKEKAAERAPSVNPSQPPSAVPEAPSANKPDIEPAPAAGRENQITVTVNGQSFAAQLEDNETAKAFRETLPLTLDMDEMNGNEKYYFLDRHLPSAAGRMAQIRTGDLMLYGSNCIVSFFQTFTASYSYTPIGHIDNAQAFADALPSGSVTVTFSAD